MMALVPGPNGVLVATIAAGASDTDAIDSGGRDLVMVQVGAAWTAADIAVLTSADGVTYEQAKFDDGSSFRFPAAASTPIRVYGPDWDGVRWFRLRSATAGTVTAANQVAAATLTLLFQED